MYISMSQNGTENMVRDIEYSNTIGANETTKTRSRLPVNSKVFYKLYSSHIAIQICYAMAIKTFPCKTFSQVAVELKKNCNAHKKATAFAASMKMKCLVSLSSRLTLWKIEKLLWLIHQLVN